MKLLRAWAYRIGKWEGIAILFSTAILIGAGVLTQQLFNEQDQARVEYLTSRMQSTVLSHVESYSNVLYSLRGLVEASNSSDKRTWEKYAQSQNFTGRFPGILSLGYVEYVPRNSILAFQRSFKERYAYDLPIGDPASQSEFFIVSAEKAIRTGKSLLGTNFAEFPSVRETLLESSRQPVALLSKPMSLKDFGTTNSQIMFVLPVESATLRLRTSGSNLEGVRGWVFLLLDLYRLLDAKSDISDSLVDFELFDGNSVTRQSLIFDADRHFMNSSAQTSLNDVSRNRPFRTTREFEVFGRRWSITTSTKPAFEKNSETISFIVFSWTVAAFLIAMCWWAVSRKKRTQNVAAAHNAADYCPLGIWSWDIAFDLVMLDDFLGPMFGYAIEECKNTAWSWSDLVHPDDLPGVLEVYGQLVGGVHESYEIEHRLKHKDGTWRWVQSRAQASHRDRSGQALVVLGTFLDITESREKIAELNAEVENAEALINAKKQFVSSISYEVRTLLTAIVGYGEMLYSKVERKEDVLSGLDNILENGRCIVEVLNALTNQYCQDSFDATASSATLPSAPNIQLSGKVLIAEDNSVNRRLVTTVLEKAGCSVTACVDGKEAVEAAEKGDFDIIIMDMLMPVMDGYTATQILRERGINKPIIALSANVMKEDVERAHQAGCNACIAKPFSRVAFLTRLFEFLHSSEGGRRRASQEFLRPQTPPEILSPECRSEQELIEKPQELQKKYATAVRIVESDEDLREIVAHFVDNLPERLNDIQEAYTNEDWDKLRLLAHSLKGAAGNVGLVSLSEDAQHLEDAAGKCERPDATEHIGKISRSAQEICSDDVRRLLSIQIH